MMFRRRRNIAILAVLGAIPLLIAIAVKVTGGRAAAGGGGVFGSITDNGIFVAFAALVAVLPLFLPMAVAVVAGESIAGEANTGTLRYLLAVPVARAPAAGGEVRQHRGLVRGRRRWWSRSSASSPG